MTLETAMRISIDGHINQAAQAMYSRSYSELTGEQARALVADLRGQGLHPEATRCGPGSCGTETSWQGKPPHRCGRRGG